MDDAKDNGISPNPEKGSPTGQTPVPNFFASRTFANRPPGDILKGRVITPKELILATLDILKKNDDQNKLVTGEQKKIEQLDPEIEKLLLELLTKIKGDFTDLQKRANDIYIHLSDEEQEPILTLISEIEALIRESDTAPSFETAQRLELRLEDLGGRILYYEEQHPPTPTSPTDTVDNHDDAGDIAPHNDVTLGAFTHDQIYLVRAGNIRRNKEKALFMTHADGAPLNNRVLRESDVRLLKMSNATLDDYETFIRSIDEGDIRFFSELIEKKIDLINAIESGNWKNVRLCRESLAQTLKRFQQMKDNPNGVPTPDTPSQRQSLAIEANNIWFDRGDWKIQHKDDGVVVLTDDNGLDQWMTSFELLKEYRSFLSSIPSSKYGDYQQLITLKDELMDAIEDENWDAEAKKHLELEQALRGVKLSSPTPAKIPTGAKEPTVLKNNKGLFDTTLKNIRYDTSDSGSVVCLIRSDNDFIPLNDQEGWVKNKEYFDKTFMVYQEIMGILMRGYQETPNAQSIFTSPLVILKNKAVEALDSGDLVDSLEKMKGLETELMFWKNEWPTVLSEYSKIIEKLASPNNTVSKYVVTFYKIGNGYREWQVAVPGKEPHRFIYGHSSNINESMRKSWRGFIDRLSFQPPWGDTLVENIEWKEISGKRVWFFKNKKGEEVELSQSLGLTQEEYVAIETLLVDYRKAIKTPGIGLAGTTATAFKERLVEQLNQGDFAQAKESYENLKKELHGYDVTTTYTEWNNLTGKNEPHTSTSRYPGLIKILASSPLPKQQPAASTAAGSPAPSSLPAAGAPPAGPSVPQAPTVSPSTPEPYQSRLIIRMGWPSDIQFFSSKERNGWHEIDERGQWKRITSKISLWDAVSDTFNGSPTSRQIAEPLYNKYLRFFESGSYADKSKKRELYGKAIETENKIIQSLRERRPEEALSYCDMLEEELSEYIDNWNKYKPKAEEEAKNAIRMEKERESLQKDFGERKKDLVKVLSRAEQINREITSTLEQKHIEREVREVITRFANADTTLAGVSFDPSLLSFAIEGLTQLTATLDTYENKLEAITPKKTNEKTGIVTILRPTVLNEANRNNVVRRIGKPDTTVEAWTREQEINKEMKEDDEEMVKLERIIDTLWKKHTQEFSDNPRDYYLHYILENKRGVLEPHEKRVVDDTIKRGLDAGEITQTDMNTLKKAFDLREARKSATTGVGMSKEIYSPSKEAGQIDVQKDFNAEQRIISNLSDADVTARRAERHLIKDPLSGQDALYSGGMVTGATALREPQAILNNPAPTPAGAPVLRTQQENMARRVTVVNTLQNALVNSRGKSWKRYAIAAGATGVGIAIGAAIHALDQPDQQESIAASTATLPPRSWRYYIQTPEKKMLLRDVESLSREQFVTKYIPGIATPSNPASIDKLLKTDAYEVLNSTEDIPGYKAEDRIKIYETLRSLEDLYAATNAPEGAQAVAKNMSYTPQEYGFITPKMTVEDFLAKVKVVVHQADEKYRLSTLTKKI